MPKVDGRGEGDQHERRQQRDDRDPPPPQQDHARHRHRHHQVVLERGRTGSRPGRGARRSGRTRRPRRCGRPATCDPPGRSDHLGQLVDGGPACTRWPSPGGWCRSGTRHRRERRRRALDVPVAEEPPGVGLVAVAEGQDPPAAGGQVRRRRAPRRWRRCGSSTGAMRARATAPAPAARVRRRRHGSCPAAPTARGRTRPGRQQEALAAGEGGAAARPTPSRAALRPTGVVPEAVGGEDDQRGQPGVERLGQDQGVVDPEVRVDGGEEGGDQARPVGDPLPQPGPSADPAGDDRR